MVRQNRMFELARSTYFSTCTWQVVNHGENQSVVLRVYVLHDQMNVCWTSLEDATVKTAQCSSSAGTFSDQWFYFRRNITHVTLKIIYFHYLKKTICITLSKRYVV